HSMEGEQKPNGAWLTFDLAKGQSVTAVSAISHVDAEGARINLRADGMQGGALLGFDRMRALSQQSWRAQLGRGRVQGGNADDRAVFYSAVYH
ncbi:glycoside hydrolase family 92 protein, partial [Pseudomonas syringae pv. tagetis]|uniref:glycoside hydrolase domain-containing protein n=1 Tax=Pseudomonas syringae group genomosp. 7 TaxID=251699 RepID=UPI00376F94AD